MIFGLSKLTLWVLTGLVAVTTVFFNVYMFLLSLWNKKDKKVRSPSETIVLALAVADVTFQLVCYFWMTMSEVDSTCYVAQVFYTTLLLIIFSFKFTIVWDTSFLTFYYSTKLVSTPNHCYTQIQAAILKHVKLAVFLIPMCGLAFCVPMTVLFHAKNYTTSGLGREDCGVLLPKTSSAEFYDVLFLLLSDVVPGLIMLKCCISISVHLLLHLRHMKASNNGTHPPKLGSQMRVIQMSLLLVANFIVYFVVDLYANYQFVVNRNTSIGFTFFITSLYTTVTAMVLIYGKKSLWKTLIHDLNSCLDEYPCLSCLKLPEHKTTSQTPATFKN
ncbi:taste receptor, type 2, member 202 [Austrofundulus limnaeus]|uniref:Taste receptor type 2 n=1 Tax=Austrofundulus limnaeus TaxID=52670 RepID=A0A2I4C9Z7_AUSLI|nr:PREDICTED: taste receptor type 2 member 19-like [Austrofundulus limnaeus]